MAMKLIYHTGKFFQTMKCRTQLHALAIHSLKNEVLYDFNDMKYRRIAAPY